MSQLDYLTAAALGVVQGLTEFLPVSSSGHLALVQKWFKLEPDSPQMLLFDVLAHLGTLLAVLIVFAGPFRRFFIRLRNECRSTWTHKRAGLRILALGVAATIPTAIIGLSLRDSFEQAFGRPRWIAVALAVTGLLLAATKWIPRPTHGWRRFTWWHAIVVGTVQAMAIMPGISRSGATICAALFLGLRRRWAAEFSFLIAVPAILGAVVLQLGDAFTRSAELGAGYGWGPVVLGSFISLIVGVFALRLLLGVVRSAKLHYFAVYCLLLSVFVFFGAGR
ncbi:MAG: undecaprenyl-diphosphate phosphatase [Planctomycetes bacterium]|nr:undecaprenyl-diphosphate phosphatase [Planctomycetota bacterium]